MGDSCVEYMKYKQDTNSVVGASVNFACLSFVIRQRPAPPVRHYFSRQSVTSLSLF